MLMGTLLENTLPYNIILHSFASIRNDQELGLKISKSHEIKSKGIKLKRMDY